MNKYIYNLFIFTNLEIKRNNLQENTSQYRVKNVLFSLNIQEF